MPPLTLLLETHSRSPCSRSRKLGQHGSVEPLGAEHVDVVQLGELLGSERLGGADHHVARVVHDDVDAALASKHLPHGSGDRLVGLHVELDGVQLHLLARGVRPCLWRVLLVATVEVTHARVDDLSLVGERAGRECSEAAAAAADEDDRCCSLALPLVEGLR